MTDFADFLTTYPSGDVHAVPKRVCTEYRSRLPEPLLAAWRSSGWGSYGNGLLWLADPEYLQPILDEWIVPVNQQSRIPFMRTAFGQIFYYRGAGSIQFFDPHYKRADFCETDVGRFFNKFLCDERIQERLLWYKIYREAINRVGPPTAEEMYALVPALALGGIFTAETVERQKMREHLSILRQT